MLIFVMLIFERSQLALLVPVSFAQKLACASAAAAAVERSSRNALIFERSLLALIVPVGFAQK